MKFKNKNTAPFFIRILFAICCAVFMFEAFYTDFPSSHDLEIAIDLEAEENTESDTDEKEDTEAKDIFAIQAYVSITNNFDKNNFELIDPSIHLPQFSIETPPPELS